MMKKKKKITKGFENIIFILLVVVLLMSLSTAVWIFETSHVLGIFFFAISGMLVISLAQLVLPKGESLF